MGANSVGSETSCYLPANLNSALFLTDRIIIFRSWGHGSHYFDIALEVILDYKGSPRKGGCTEANGDTDGTLLFLVLQTAFRTLLLTDRRLTCIC